MKDNFAILDGFHVAGTVRTTLAQAFHEIYDGDRGRCAEQEVALSRSFCKYGNRSDGDTPHMNRLPAFAVNKLSESNERKTSYSHGDQRRD